MKKIHDLLIFCADLIDVLTNFAVLRNVVIKRVHCNSEFLITPISIYDHSHSYYLCIIYCLIYLLFYSCWLPICLFVILII